MATPEHSRSGSDDRVRALERTLEALREESEVAHVLLGLAGALAEVRTVEETLEKAVRIVPELFGAQRCFAAAWEPGRRTFAVEASTGFEDRAALRGEVRSSPVLHEALAGHAPVFVADARADERLRPRASCEQAPGACVTIPLSRWGEAFGALQIEFSGPRTFNAKDRALARGVARQLGATLANARRFNLLQDLRAFGLRVGSQLRLQSVVSEVVAGAAELLSAAGAALYFLDSSNSSLVLSGEAGLAPAAAERLARIELESEPWRRLTDSTVLWVPDLPAVTGVADAPRAAVGVPVPGGDAGLRGAILVFFDRPFRLGPDEAEALSVFAAQSGTAVSNAQRFERQRRVAHSLQQGLLAVEVPPMKDWEVGAVYEPAAGEAEIGGDFFDVFDVGEGRVGISVGDVSGKGAEAAAGTAMAKYMLRAFAMRHPAPTSVLFHLNNALAHSFDDDRFTTLVYALFDPSNGDCRLAVGGHPPPLVYRAGRGSVEVVAPKGAIIGAFQEQRFEESVVTLARGDVLLAYTDGLVEARNGHRLFGRDGLSASLARHGREACNAHEIARRCFEDARAFGSIVDDAIVVALTTRRGTRL